MLQEGSLGPTPRPSTLRGNGNVKGGAVNCNDYGLGYGEEAYVAFLLLGSVQQSGRNGVGR